MKKIINYTRGTVCDIESDGLLDEATKVHVLSFKLAGKKIRSIRGDNEAELKKFLNWHASTGTPLVGHNFIRYDIPLLEKILEIDLSKLIVIDTLNLSRLLKPSRNEHGLATFFEDYGIAKPKIDDWEGLSYGEYKYRCEEDVAINAALWDDLIGIMQDVLGKGLVEIKAGAVDGVRESDDEVQYIDKYKSPDVTTNDLIHDFLTYVMFKDDTARLREKTRWPIDTDKLHQVKDELEVLIRDAAETLEEVMPKVPVYGAQKLPKIITKKNGEFTSSAEKWNQAVENLSNRAKDDLGNPICKRTDDPECIKVIKKYNPPNINSHQQIKDFLYVHGWKPRSFKFVVDEEAREIWVQSKYRKDLKPKPRAIPQINIDGDDGKELCKSVLELAERVPEIMAYSKYTMIKHRYDMMNGFVRDLSKDNHLVARVGGITNTMRDKHRELVNLPGADKPFAHGIRSVLTCYDGTIMLGSDMSSLEDRAKHHFAVTIDPEFVETVNRPEYDPHIEMAYKGGFISKQEFDDFMEVAYAKEVLLPAGEITKEGIEEILGRVNLINAKSQRPKGKTTNYAAVYGAGAKTIAISADIPLEEAEALHKAYWEIHAYVKEIAESQCVIEDDSGGKWLINPINGFPYSLRKEKDRFSTLIQGTGTFFFDMWLDNILEGMYARVNTKTLTGTFHDEFIVTIKDHPKTRAFMEKLTRDSIQKVNETYMLRRSLDCDVQFGKRYSEIH